MLVSDKLFNKCVESLYIGISYFDLILEFILNLTKY